MRIDQALERSVRALGGVWDTQRAVTALHAAGRHDGDQRQQDKRARYALRKLAANGLLVKIQDRPVQYRAAEQ
ncbi:hypothetical protein [Streptomyces sp. SID8499]|uniref:hypothetical protein n=1 Tax=Streptomyces sp. SID8499 TaxID=2706106 RepID=UPI001943E806|nr:hypothetical protein [Streptomyces sp. SID8499]